MIDTVRICIPLDKVTIMDYDIFKPHPKYIDRDTYCYVQVPEDLKPMGFPIMRVKVIPRTGQAPLKEFRIEKIKAYGILNEYVQEIDFNNIENIKKYNDKFYFKYCYAYTSEVVNKWFLDFSQHLKSLKTKIVDKTISEKDAKDLGYLLGKLTLAIREDIQKDKEYIING